MSHRVSLHIGTMKSATTYLQGLCELHSEHLAAAGILWPMGIVRYAAIRDLFGKADPHTDPPAAWQSLTQRMASHEGHVVLSNELLASLDKAQVRQLLRSVKSRNIHVVITARDPARVIPSAWQTEVRNAVRTNTWRAYSNAVCTDLTELAHDPDAEAVHRRFWRQHDLPRLVERWTSFVPADHITVVTVPPSGADPEEVARRFGRAVGVELGGLTQPRPRANNGTLGAHSTELVRRVSAAMPDADSAERVYGIKMALAGTTLTPRAGAEPRFGLSADQLAWANARARSMVDALSSSGIRLEGDLEDLIPDAEPTHSTVDPGCSTDTELLAAAIDGLVGMARSTARLRQRCKELRRELDQLGVERDLVQPQITRTVSDAQVTSR